MEIEKKKEAAGTADTIKKYELSALIDADSFFYTYNSGDQIIKSEQLPTEEFFSNDWTTQFPGMIEKGKVGVVNPYFTIIPTVDYDTQHLSSLVTTAAGNVLIHDPIYRSDFLPGLNAYLCYALSASLLGQLRELFADFGLCHVVTALIKNIDKAYGISLIHLCRMGRQTVLIARNEHRLLLATILDVNKSLSLVYYAMLVIKNYQLDLKKVRVEFSGDFEPDDEFTILFKSYFGMVSFRDTHLSYEDDARSLPSKFFPVRSVALCV